jgi:hypothetical protein
MVVIQGQQSLQTTPQFVSKCDYHRTPQILSQMKGTRHFAILPMEWIDSVQTVVQFHDAHLDAKPVCFDH